MITKENAPHVGTKAPEFLIDTSEGRLSTQKLAAQYENLVLTTQDSYRYHPN
jgi:hypothetical protein